MKLYLYDHCPFCIRTEMTAHYKEVDCEQIYLLNDDEETCYRLVNAKQVPILEFDDGRAMPESLDIAKVFDEIGNPARIIRPQTNPDAIVQHFTAVATHISCLLYPRTIESGAPEFATQSARDYFRRKKEKSIARTFEQARQETPQHKAAVEAMLTKLPLLPLPADHNDTLGWDDILIYPTLRNLTLVKDLQFPDAVRRYVETVARFTRTHTYFDRAL